MLNLIKELSQAYGPSGREEEVRSLIQGELQGKVEDVYTDSLGNLVAVREGKGKRIMVAAHMDEIGLIVTHVDDEGFLRFSSIGGLLPTSVMGRRFLLPGGIRATVGVEKSEDLKDLSFKKMYLDIGARDKKEALKEVGIGHMAVFESSFAAVGSRFSGKAMDDRIGCAVLLKALEEVQTHNEIYFVFTVQEEVGLRGARTSAYRLNPEIGLAVDVTRSGDTPEAHKMAVGLGKGPAVKVKDTSMIAHPRVKERMMAVAEKEGIPYQLEVLERGGTDAGGIHMTREGIPSGVMSIPCRYIHTAAEMVDAGDVDYARRFLVTLLEDSWE